MRPLVRSVVPNRIRRLVQVPTRLDALGAEIAAIRSMVEHQGHVLSSLNHTIVFGGESGLPLLIDVADRVRTDADTAIAALHAMERVLADAAHRLESATRRFEETGG